MLTLRIQNPSPLPAGLRLREVDELKGWAMVLVILYHTGGVFGWGNWFHGDAGVDVFLLVSGFTLARNSRDLPWTEFVKRRVARIFPAYWIALGLFLFLRAHYYDLHPSTGDIVYHILGLHGFVLSRPEYFADINDSFWFISLILLMYAAFLVVRKHIVDAAWVLGFGLVLTAVASFAYMQAVHAGGLSRLAGSMPNFFFGLVAGQLSLAPTTEFKLGPVFIAGLLALAWLGWATGFFPFNMVAGPAMTAIFLVARNTLKNHPDGRFLLTGLAVIGVYSYEIFLFHQPMIRDFNKLFLSRCFGLNDPSTGQLALSWVAGLLVTGGLSFVVHKATNRFFALRKTAPSAVAA
jgi:peptidoglycan/LPS O-acetylase OafA/YrhL